MVGMAMNKTSGRTDRAMWREPDQKEATTHLSEYQRFNIYGVKLLYLLAEWLSTVPPG